MGGPIASPSTCQSLGLLSPPHRLIMRVVKSWNRQKKWGGGVSKASSPSISFPWLGKCLRERALSVPGRRWHVQSKLALSQHLALVNAFSQLRNWAKFGQRPIQSPVLEYVSIPPLHLLSPESPEGQTSCSHTGLSSVWLDITFPLQEKN